MAKNEFVEDIEIYEGEVYPLIIKKSVPVLWGLLFQFLYNIVDTYFVSLINKNEPYYISGIGVVYPLIFFLIAIMQGLQIGISTYTAFIYGKKKFEEIYKLYNTSISFVILFSSILLIFIIFFNDNIIHILIGNSVSDKIIKVAKEYILFYSPSILFMFLSSVFFGILQGKGETKYIGKVMMISTIINTILDPILIFYFHLGVKGAALATTISNSINLLYGLWIFTKNKTKVLHSYKFELQKKYIKEIFSLGFPHFLSLVVLSIAFTLLNRLVGKIGEYELNSFILVGRLDNIIFVPIIAISTALNPLIGQNFSRNNISRVKEIYFKSLILLFVVSIFLNIIYVVFSEEIFSFFSNIKEVIKIASLQVKYTNTSLLIGAGIGIISRAVLQAIGKPKYSLFIIVLRVLIINIPLAYIFVYLFGYNMLYLWYSFIITNFSIGIISYILTIKTLKKYENN